MTLLGPAAEVPRRAAALGLDLGDTPVLDPAGADAAELREPFASRYTQARAHKGVTVGQARDVVVSPAPTSTRSARRPD